MTSSKTKTEITMIEYSVDGSRVLNSDTKLQINKLNNGH